MLASLLSLSYAASACARDPRTSASRLCIDSESEMSANAGVVRAMTIAMTMAARFTPVISPSEPEMREYGDKP